MEEFASDKVTMLVKAWCNECQQTSYPKDIIKNSYRDTDNLYKFRCKCTNEISPPL